MLEIFERADCVGLTGAIADTSPWLTSPEVLSASQARQSTMVRLREAGLSVRAAGDIWIYPKDEQERALALDILRLAVADQTEQVICPKCGKEQAIPHSDEPAIWCQCQHCGDRFLAERDE